MENRALIIDENESIFHCPICRSPMKIDAVKSLYCVNRHTYDISKYGYINFTNKPNKTKYTKELFDARRKLIRDDGFFEPLSQTLVKKIIQSHALNGDRIMILDTGSGEGSHLADICKKVGSATGKKVLGIGIDLSKEGVLAASKRYHDQVWAVADLANPPFKDKQFDIILNILSPSNYTQFDRLLKDDGLLFKVVPSNGHLRELREGLIEKRDDRQYTNEETIYRFKKWFKLFDSFNLMYTKRLNQQSLFSLVKMTPLSWATTEEKIRSFLEKDIGTITVDLDILVGRKHEEV